jgi:hypothetical protein
MRMDILKGYGTSTCPTPSSFYFALEDDGKITLRNVDIRLDRDWAVAAVTAQITI